MSNPFQDFLDDSSMNEAHKIGTRVEIVKGSAKGITGHIGEIRHGAYAGAPKTYTVYHGAHGATQVPKEHVRAVKEEVELDESASVSVTVQAGAPAHQKYAVTEIHPKKSPRGRTRWKDVSYHSSADEAKTAADAHAKKNNLHRMQVSATQGFNEALDTHEQAMAHKKQADTAMDKNDLQSYHAHMSAHHESMGQWHESKGRNSTADREYEKAEKHHELSVKKATQKNEEVEELEELSKETLQSYKKKAMFDLKKTNSTIGSFSATRAQKDAAAAERRKRNKGMHRAIARTTVNEEVELDEAVSVEHDRYMRSHGKKASGSESSNWMFTHKRYGDVDHKNSKEVHQTRGSFADAAKSAKKWAKAHGHSTVYVMEGVELEEKTLTPAELKKREEIAKAMEREKPGMDKSRKMAIATAVAKRVAEQYDEAE